MTRRAGTRFATIGVLVLAAGCATASGPGAAARMSEASAAMERDEFGTATSGFSTLVSACPSGGRARLAALLLIAAELDPGNADGSPEAATLRAERFLRLPDASPEERLLARSLYRLAVHLETLVPASTAEGDLSRDFAVPADDCPAPVAPSKGDMGEPAAPWLLVLDSRMRGMRHRIAELEAEIERITDLLTSGTPSDAPRR